MLIIGVAYHAYTIKRRGEMTFSFLPFFGAKPATLAGL
jgi:hypothetical protein